MTFKKVAVLGLMASLLAACGDSGPSEEQMKKSVEASFATLATYFVPMKVVSFKKKECSKESENRYKCSFTMERASTNQDTNEVETVKEDTTGIFTKDGENWIAGPMGL